jgi:hypothetical protein
MLEKTAKQTKQHTLPASMRFFMAPALSLAIRALPAAIAEAIISLRLSTSIGRSRDPSRMYL